MHIVFCEAHYDSYSGAQQSLEPLLRETGFEKKTVLVPQKGKFTDNVDAGNSKIVNTKLGTDVNTLVSDIRLQGSILSAPIAALTILNHYQKVARYLSQTAVDVVYCNNLTSLWLYGPPAVLAGKPIIWFVRSDSETYPALNQLGTKLADYIILISKGVTNRFNADDLGELNEKFEVINTGIDMTRFSAGESNGEEGGPIRILHAATIQPRKGQQDLLEAVDSVSDQMPDFKLEFAGSVSPGHEDYYRSFKESIDRSAITDQVELLGYREDMPELLNSCDFVVLPSYSEGLPRIILEASATSTPCIATNVGGAEEIITEGVNGYLVETGDIETLSQRILDLSSNAELRDDMGRKARETVENRFSVENYVANFESFVRENISD